MRPPKQPQRHEVSPEDRVYWDRAVRRWTGDPTPETYNMGTYFGALMASPPMCAIASEMGTFFRNAGNRPHTYTHRQRELIDQVFAADWKTNVVARFHILDAVSSGMPLKTIKALRYGHEEELDKEDALLVKYIRQVISGTVDDKTYAKVEKAMGSERGIVEYTGFILWLNWIMRMMQALNTGTQTEEQIDQLIADIESGKQEIPDYRIGTSVPMSRYDR